MIDREKTERIKKHLDFLGMRCQDAVTGKEGVVTSIAFDLYGCVQALINPGLDEDSKFQDSFWLDVSRLIVIDSSRVMDPPDFNNGDIAEGKKGHAEKPSNFKV